MDIKLETDMLKFKVRTNAIIIVDNKLLVTKYYNTNTYSLPGGYVEMGESSREGMTRELEEELQVKMEVGKLVGIIENFFTNRKLEKMHEISFYYLANFQKVEDIKFYDYSLMENDKGHILENHFTWLPIARLEEFDLRPSVIKKIIKTEDFTSLWSLINKE